MAGLPQIPETSRLSSHNQTMLQPSTQAISNADGSPKPQLSGAQTQLSAQTNVDKSIQARAVFNLSVEEALLLDVFAMKRQNGLYMAGRLYLFTHFLGFHSNMWGKVVKRLVPLKAMQGVHKKRHVGANRTLGISFEGRTYDFHNVSDRAVVYDAILAQWKAVNPEAVHAFTAELQKQKEQDAEDEKSDRVSKKLNTLLTGITTRKILDSQTANKEVTNMSEYSSDNEPDDDGDDSNAFKVDEQAIEALWAMANETEASSVPPVPSDWIRVGTLELPALSRQVAVKLFLSDFMKRFQESMSSKNVVLDGWKEAEDLGMVRAMRYKFPNSMPIGPAEISCHQNMRLRPYDQEYFVMETEQLQLNIPFGDYFVIEGRWDVYPSSNATSAILDLWVHVKFVKSTMMRSKIETNTLATHRKQWVPLSELIVASFRKREGTKKNLQVDLLADVVAKLPQELRSEAAAILGHLLPNSPAAACLSPAAREALSQARAACKPKYVSTGKQSLDYTVLFSVMLAVLLSVLLLLLVAPILSSSLYSPEERLLEKKLDQPPIVIPADFWVSMLDFYKELSAIRQKAATGSCAGGAS